MNGCCFTDAQGVCADREARCNLALNLCHTARMELQRLQRQMPADQSDLFAETAEPAAVAFWEGVWEAVALESRRMHRVFWRRCQHRREVAA